MLKRFFEAKSFRFHVPKVIQVPKMIFFEYFGWEIMYVVVYVLCMYYVCIICMYYMYVLYVCITCMYFMYVLYVCIVCMYYMYVFDPWLRSPSGGQNPRKTQPANPDHFLKMALKLVLIADSESTHFFM